MSENAARRGWRFRQQPRESPIDRIIREATERGDFDNLPGTGQPLPSEPWDPELGMAHHVLKQAGETLPWIALGKEIEQHREQLEQWLQRTTTLLERHRGTPAWHSERARARARYLEQAADLDKLLLNYALEVPVSRLEKGRFPAYMAERQFDAACPA